MSRVFGLKIVMMGDGGVGKTSLVLRYTKNTFTASYKQTLGATFAVKYLERGNDQVNVMIWDLAGQPSFDQVRKQYYDGADGGLLVFDLTQSRSIKALNKWLTDFRQIVPDGPVYLVGNKIDLTADRQITEESIGELKASLGILFFETSCLTGEGVEETFNKLAWNILANRGLTEL